MIEVDDFEQFILHADGERLDRALVLEIIAGVVCKQVPSDLALKVALGNANNDPSVFRPDLCNDRVPLTIWALKRLNKPLGEIPLLPADGDAGPIDVLLAGPAPTPLADLGLLLALVEHARSEVGLGGGDGMVLRLLGLLLLGEAGEHRVCVV